MREGNITISRPIFGSGKQAICINVIDQSSRANFLEVEIGLEEFTLALTGQGHVPCLFEVRNLNRIGKIKETKTELVPTPEVTYSHLSQVRKVVAAPFLAPFEVDGWLGSADDLFNSRCSVREGDRHFQRVTFIRYVDPPAAE